MVFSLFILFSYLTLNNAFNLDIGETIWRFNGDANSNFGMSLSLNKESEGAGRGSVIVGSPQYQTTGAVYKCTNNNQCGVVGVKSTTSSDPATTPQFGHSLSSDGNSFLSCSPLWAHQINNAGQAYIGFKGQCTLTNKNITQPRYNVGVCNNEPNFQNNGYGYCISGFSSATVYTGTNNAPFYFIGAPGAVRYRGALYGIYGNNALVIKTSVTPPDRSSFLGYSLAWGKLSNDKYGDVVGGAPRDNSLRGRVLIYAIAGEPNDNLRFQYLDDRRNVVEDEQVGSYFGASICIVDLNNDGKDDLLVGAPRYSRITDEGRVYVYLNRRGAANSLVLDLLRTRLEGERRQGARFGTTITSIGDVNNDGFNDFAIGAPGNDFEEKGAVYIYMGGREGIRPSGNTVHTQVIYASDIPKGGGLGFGKAISGGMDIDGNTYPDLAIGSPHSSRAFLLRSNPLVTMKDNLQVNVTAVPVRVSCKGPDSKDYHCVLLKLNLEYEGRGTQPQTDVEVTIDLDTKNIIVVRRAFVINNNNQLSPKLARNVTLSKNGNNEIPLNVYFAVDIFTDVSRSIEIQTSYRIYKNPSGCGEFPCPILDQFGKTSTVIELSYLRECGADKVCNPEVAIANPRVVFPNSKFQNQKEIIYGSSSDKFNLQADLSNNGEAAYSAIMMLNYSSDFEISSIEIDRAIVQATAQKVISSTVNQVEFPVANPIRPGGKLLMNVNFVLKKQQPSETKYLFSMLASAFGNDTDESNNKASVEVGTRILSCINTQGETSTSRAQFEEDSKKLGNLANSTVEDLGPEINYTFVIQNAGRLPVDGLLATVELAGKSNEDIVLYVVDLTVDGVQCPGNELNPWNLTIPEPEDKGSNATLSVSRKRRDLTESNPQTAKSESVNTAVSKALTSCEKGGCRKYTCRINSINDKLSSRIILRTRFYAGAAAQLNLQQTSIPAKIKVEFNGTNSNLNFQRAGCVAESKATLFLTPLKLAAPEKEELKWWIVLLAIIGALALLAIIAGTLYWTGFFKREKSFEELQQEESENAPPVQTKPTLNPNFQEDDDD